MEKLSIIGNITADAVIREVNGKHVINFNLAVNKKFEKNGQKIEKVTFYKCAIWRDNTSIAQYIKKGDKLFVEGLPEVETYQNKNGETVAHIKINVYTVELLGGNRKSESNQQESTAVGSENNDGPLVPTPDSDLPF